MNKNNWYILMIFLFLFLFLFGCEKEKAITNSNPPDLIIPTLEDQDVEEAGKFHLEYSENDIEGSSQSGIQTTLRKINYHSRLELESISVIVPDGDIWYIWKSVDEGFTEKANTVVVTDIFDVAFGPIDGFENEFLRIGWNNRNRVMYIEVLSNEVITHDGIRLGHSKEKIIDILGDPFIKDSDQFRYQNIDFEVAGMLFLFENNVVTKIYLFAYV